MRKELSPKQAYMLVSIESFIARTGYSPTIRELAKELGYRSSSTAHSLVDKLVEKGYISRAIAGPRTIRVLKDASPPAETYNGIVKFKLSYCGVDEGIEFNANGLTKGDVEQELVQWVLEQVDHWIEM